MIRDAAIGLSFVLAAGASAAGLPPGTLAPTTQEQAIFDARLARLKQNAILMPTAVNDAIDTFAGTVTKTMSCPAGTAVATVTLNVTTQLVHWDRALGEGGSAATYHWNVEDTASDGRKTVTCTNWLMLDAGVTSRDEASGLLGQIIGEGLLYHELLHCQLLINAFRDDAAWQEKICNGAFDLSAADPSHTVINPTVDGYVEARVKGQGSIRIVTAPAAKADSAGNFDVRVDGPRKKEFEYEFSFPSDGNIDARSVSVTASNGAYHVRGKLKDKTRAGQLYVRIDPPLLLYVIGLEHGIVILPHSPD